MIAVCLDLFTFVVIFLFEIFNRFLNTAIYNKNDGLNEFSEFIENTMNFLSFLREIEN